MKHLIFSFVVMALAVLQMQAQNDLTNHNPRRCYTHEHYQQEIDEGKRLSTSAYEERLRRLKNQHVSPDLRNTTTYTIPIIFHIIHDGEPVGSGDNVSQAHVIAQVEQLNNDFRKVAGSTGEGNGVDSGIEFCLATVDPDGNLLPEPGIHRVNRNNMGWTAPPYGEKSLDKLYIEGTIKPATIWDVDNYLNMWSLDMGGGVLGYAQFPVSGLPGISPNGGAGTDGVVIRPSTIGSTSFPGSGGNNGYGRTSTHEIGHWLGLRHIWGDGGCNVDDYCDDTPRSDEANYGCPTGHESCGTLDNIQNYMDYTDDLCMNNFSQDQVDRMRTVMATASRRASLANSTKCQLPNPMASFKNFPNAAPAEGTSCGEKTLLAQVKLSDQPSATTTINLNVSGTATGGGVDYTLNTGTEYTFTTTNWNTPQDISITIVEDGLTEGDETIIFDMVSVTGSNVTEFANQQIKFTIKDDDLDPRYVNEDVVTLFSEDFEGGASLPSGWATSGAGDGFAVSTATSVTGIVASIPESTTKKGPSAFAYVLDCMTDFDPACKENLGNEILTTPSFKVSEHTSVLRLYFDLYFQGTSGETLTLKISKDGGQTFPISVNLAGEADWQSRGFNLNSRIPAAGTGEEDWVLKFVYSDNGSLATGVALDNIRVRAIAKTPSDVASSENTTTGFSETNLGPNETVYFYDQSSNEVMCKIENLSNHDYGCTRVEIDRAGIGATDWVGGNDVTIKTLKVTPTNDKVDGEYKITMYYKNDELGTLTPSSVAKSKGGIANATVANSDVSDIVVADFGDGGKSYTAHFFTGFSGFGLSDAIPNNPLPVELTTFSGEIEEAVNVLNWSTASELNNDYFEVERSADGTRFETIGKVTGNGTTTESQDYEFVDKNPTTFAYYRLRQVDFDGTYEYSKVITLKRDIQGYAVSSISPNPTKETARIQIEAVKDMEVEITLFDITGKELSRKEITLQAGDNTHQVDVSTLPRGMYFLHLNSAQKKEVHRLIKK